MDPQKLSQLDPKLRDAYQRVMGTTIPEPQAAPVQQAQTPPQTPNPAPAPPPMPQPEPTPIPTIEDPITQPTEPPVSQPQPLTPEPSVQTSNFVQMNSEVAAAPSSPNFSAPAPMPQAQTMTVKKKNSMMPILIGVAALIFVVIYALFWTKIFNFKLPFLP